MNDGEQRIASTLLLCIGSGMFLFGFFTRDHDILNGGIDEFLAFSGLFIMFVAGVFTPDSRNNY